VLLLACLINLLPECFGAPSLSQSYPATFLGCSCGIQSDVFASLFQAQCPQSVRKAICQAPPDILIQGSKVSKSLSLGDLRRQVLVTQRTWKGLGTKLGNLVIGLVRTWIRFLACLKRQKGSLINSQWDTLITAFWGWNLSQVQGAGWKYCAVWVCERVSLRYSPAMKRVWSPDLRVHGNSYGLEWIPTGPLVWGLYGLTMAKRCLNPSKEKGWRRWSKWCCFLLCAGEEDPYLLLFLSLSWCLVTGEMGERESKNTPPPPRVHA
jgi:hypothetical protein